MPYNPRLDALVEDFGEIPLDEKTAACGAGTSLWLGMYSYGGKDRKLAVKRIVRSRANLGLLDKLPGYGGSDSREFVTPLGRFSREELGLLLPHLKRIVKDDSFWRWNP